MERIDGISFYQSNTPDTSSSSGRLSQPKDSPSEKQPSAIPDPVDSYERSDQSSDISAIIDSEGTVKFIAHSSDISDRQREHIAQIKNEAKARDAARELYEKFISKKRTKAGSKIDLSI